MTNSQSKAVEKIKKDYYFAKYIDVYERHGIVGVVVGEITISTIFSIGKRGKVEEIKKED